MLFQVQSLVDKESRDVKKTVLSEFKQAKKDTDAKLREWKKAHTRYKEDMKAGLQSAMIANLDRQDKVLGQQGKLDVQTTPRNPRHLHIIEGGRVYQTVFEPKYCLQGTCSGRTTVSDTFGRPDGV